MSHTLTLFLLCKETAEFFLGKLVSSGFTVTPGLNESKAIRYNENAIGCALYVFLEHSCKFEKSHDVICSIIKDYDIFHFGYNYRSDSGSSYIVESNIPRTKKVIKAHKKPDNNIIDFNSFKSKDSPQGDGDA